MVASVSSGAPLTSVSPTFSIPSKLTIAPMLSSVASAALLKA